jgi:hypothetical protein
VHDTRKKKKGEGGEKKGRIYQCITIIIIIIIRKDEINEEGRESCNEATQLATTLPQQATSSKFYIAAVYVCVWKDTVRARAHTYTPTLSHSSLLHLQCVAIASLVLQCCLKAVATTKMRTCVLTFCVFVCLLFFSFQR